MKNKRLLTSLAVMLAIGISWITIAGNANQVLAVSRSAQSKYQITIASTDVYTKDGGINYKYPGVNEYGKLKDNTKLNTNGIVKTVDNMKCYDVGHGGYIDTSRVTKINNRAAMTIGHNSRVYNKYGKKLWQYHGQSSLLKNGTAIGHIDDVVSLNNVDGKKYFLVSNNEKQYSWLPYKVIRGTAYYNIGDGGYIKAANVNFINSNVVFTDQEPVKITKEMCNFKKDSVTVFNDQGKATPKQLKIGQKIIVDRTIDPYVLTGIYGDDDDDDGYKQMFYHIKDTKEFISITFGYHGHALLNYDQPLGVMKVKVLSDSNLYTSTGTNVIDHFDPAHNIALVDPKHPNQTHETQVKDTTVQIKKNTEEYVTEARYLWVPSEQKAELFYKLRSPYVSGPEYLGIENGEFVKAADVEYVSGSQLTPVNTADTVVK
ncbi:SLAP domain-containing protein [Lactobacillus sp. ESL0785]|uniref:SLAP domain-containing protein n=1 Tax=Lactobacillus sp. ESL0785 TaxID=2983232 RepID=UPI0023FA07D6|nr:SLAP domain-containing protein [Lactobacillus sp. ESL0785]WEV71209.1 SLAP domain-containing protein [Lactobacillus sp. ESL0785]